SSGNGEGQIFLGTGLMTTLGSGDGTFGGTFSAGTLGQVVTVTVTDPNNNTSEFSACVTPMRPLPSPPTITAIPSSPNFGQTVTFTATVTGLGPIPTGSVTFKDGSTTLVTVSLDGAGQATFTTTSLSLGPHTISAVYGGDEIYLGSTGTITQTVNPGAPSVTTAISSPNPSTLGQTVTITATITGGGPPVPTGSITFKDAPTTLGIVSLNGAGQATLTTSSLTVG